jgi:hypothetical protein
MIMVQSKNYPVKIIKKRLNYKNISFKKFPKIVKSSIFKKDREITKNWLQRLRNIKKNMCIN